MDAVVPIQLDRRALASVVRSSPEFHRFTRELERDTVRLAQQTAMGRVSRRSGAYVTNFETTVTPITGSLTILARLRLFNTKHYAIYIEVGTVAHLIPKVADGRLLVFDYKGKKVFTREQVRHPGTKAQRVIRDTLLKIANGLHS